MPKKINWKGLFIILLIASTAYAVNEVVLPLLIKKEKAGPREVIQLVYDINDPFSEIKVRKYLHELHVKYVDVAIAQMKLESASGTSKVFKEGNNLFGMKMPSKRPTTALGVKNGHAYYSHWRMSCIDYALFQAYTMDLDNISSEMDWLNYIGRVYAEDSQYKKKLLAIKSQDKTSNNSKL